MSRDIVKIGIMPAEALQRRMIDIAAGRIKPKRDEPRIWFHSLKSATEILSDGNRELLKKIFEEKPASFQELARMTGRHLSNLSRTLNKMEQYGLVRIQRRARAKVPTARGYEFDIQMRGPA